MTLDVATQMNVRLDILPPTNIYQTDILSQKLSKFIVTFYTDTIFSDDTSVQGNNCTLKGAYLYMYTR